jgi:ubiquinone/menaquinone biosynthesis C-methylase UbiE
MVDGFQLDGQGPRAYERYLVPAFFVPCAEQLLDLAAVGPGERVLDVACGTGIVARRATARVGAGGRVFGIDVNDGMIDVARTVAADTSAMDAPPAIEWRSGDAAALPLSNGTFDVVCCQQGLQFFTDQAGALQEMIRVLAPGGRLTLAIWRDIDHHPVFAKLTRALDRYVGEDAAAMMRSPFAGPDRERLRSLVAAAGFDKILIRVGVITVRFPSAREFLRQEVASTPLAEPVGALDEHRREALIHHLDEALRPYLDDDGVVFPMQTWLVAAGRES